jgi:hypothetical protein
MKNVTELTKENRKEQMLKMANYISEPEVKMDRIRAKNVTYRFHQNDLVHHT